MYQQMKIDEYDIYCQITKQKAHIVVELSETPNGNGKDRRKGIPWCNHSKCNYKLDCPHLKFKKI